MNSSGKTARLIDKAWPELIPSGKLLVIHDVLNLEPTQTMPRKDGLDQGHLGVRDVMETLRTTNFHRFAIGIGRPSAQARRRGTTAGWVTSQCGRDELDACDDNGSVTLTAWSWLHDIMYPSLESKPRRQPAKMPRKVWEALKAYEMSRCTL